MSSIEDEGVRKTNHSNNNDDDDNNNNSSKLRKDRAKARWSILRNALLQRAQDESDNNNKNDNTQQEKQHSIHRFPGYDLLRPQPETKIDPIVSKLLKEYHWDQQITEDMNLERLEIAVLALACCFPKGACLKIIGCCSTSSSTSTSTMATLNETIKQSNSEQSSELSWMKSLKEKCHPTVSILKVDDDKNTTGVTLLVQEGSKQSSSTKKYKCRQYVLDDRFSLYTREPYQTRLSLQDLVSHRTTGVDNTGNICVWDSERVLSYLLYHHLNDWPTSIQQMCQPNHNDTHEDDSTSSTNMINILELGTGMAGLAAVALGLRLQQEQQQEQQNSDKMFKQKSIRIMLTDGHHDGVKNNLINKYLTNVFVSGSTTGSISDDNDNNKKSINENVNNIDDIDDDNEEKSNNKKKKQHPYHKLNISAKVLLWTTDFDSSSNDQSDNDNNRNIVSNNYNHINDDNNDTGTQDIVLISDCVHFQNFHSALAITILRLLKVNGIAILCQPKRSNSLSNFYNLFLEVVVAQVLQVQEGERVQQQEQQQKEEEQQEQASTSKSLVSLSWWNHPILESQHQKALDSNHNNTNNNNNIYDENIHYPKILIVTKLRTLTKQDCNVLIAYHEKQQKAKIKTEK